MRYYILSTQILTTRGAKQVWAPKVVNYLKPDAVFRVHVDESKREQWSLTVVEDTGLNPWANRVSAEADLDLRILEQTEFRNTLGTGGKTLLDAWMQRAGVNEATRTSDVAGEVFQRLSDQHGGRIVVRD